jgi:ketosteroid isomerase-like protein
MNEKVPIRSYHRRIAVQPARTGDLMSESNSLPTEPEGMAAALRERFNSGKVNAMMTLYEPGAVLIAKDGRTVTGHTGIAAELERDLRLGLPLKAKARHVFVAGDIAEIVLDWSIEGPVPTAHTCTSEARQAMSCAAARTDSGGT